MRDALPHASFIGFTGTSIELQAVFGDNEAAAIGRIATLRSAAWAPAGRATAIRMGHNPLRV
jgi:hypothetical protein